MLRLRADAPADRWVTITGSLGWSGRRHRKAAIRMLLSQASGAAGRTPGRGSRVLAWSMSQAAPLLLRRADGRVLVWVWKTDPEQVVALAQIQQATPELRTARAMMPIEYDDTETFSNPHLGNGERLLVDLPADPRTPPFATYSWDLVTHVVTLTAVWNTRTSVGVSLTALDDLARSLRTEDELPVHERGPVLRIEPH